MQSPQASTLTSFGSSSYNVPSGWVDTAKQRWGNHFLGIYGYDEPGGKMLDITTDGWYPNEDNTSIYLKKLDNSSISICENIAVHTTCETFYYSTGTVKVITNFPDKSKTGTLYVSYPDLPENYDGPDPVIIHNFPYPKNCIWNIQTEPVLLSGPKQSRL